MTATAPHQAIYRRWRAQKFGEIVGQGPIVTTLQNAVRGGRLAHALLFVGPRGTGKTSLARIVAKAMNCTDLRDGEPCDRCPACVSIREGRALDVIEMDAASNNRVDDIRELLPRIQTAPSDVRRKVFIVDEVQRIKEGWDVLLKTLEEPPEHVAFIFCTTDSSQVRPAVLSRVQRFDFRRLTVDEIAGKLATILHAEGRAADPEALDTIARLADGGMRDAESMLDQLLATSGERIDAMVVRGLLGLAEAETVERFAAALVAGDAAVGLPILADLEDRGLDLRVFMDQVVETLRASIASRLTAGDGGMGVSSLAAAAGALAAIDPARPGTGGLRLRLELALLAARSTVASPAASPEAVGASASDLRGAEPPIELAPGSAASGASGEGPQAPAAVPAHASARGRPPAPTRDRRGTPERGDEPPARGSAAAARPTPLDDPRPTGAGGPSERSPAPPPPVAPDEASLEALRERWPEIVAYISLDPPTKPLINACRPIAVEGAVVTLGFPEGQGFLAEVARKRRPKLEAGIGHFLGREVAVECIATNVDLAPAPLDADGARLLAEARRIFADDLPDVGEVG